MCAGHMLTRIPSHKCRSVVLADAGHHLILKQKQKEDRAELLAAAVARGIISSDPEVLAFRFNVRLTNS